MPLQAVLVQFQPVGLRLQLVLQRGGDRSQLLPALVHSRKLLGIPAVVLQQLDLLQ